jgi:6-phosphogluconate dehydrogenase
MQQLADIGIWGLGVGRNLALNFAAHGFTVSIADSLAASPPAFVAGLSQPRRILLMVKAGKAVDDAIDALTPLRAPGDAIDGGNTPFRDTQRRDHFGAHGFQRIDREGSFHSDWGHA